MSARSGAYAGRLPTMKRRNTARRASWAPCRKRRWTAKTLLKNTTASAVTLSGKWNNCSFDWLLTASNMVKVLEGNYDRAERNNIVNENSSFDIDELYAAALRRGSMG